MDTLAIGDRAYSSWSLRGWLLFDAFGLAVETRLARLYSDAVARVLADFAPARTVPALRLADGTLVMESLAIAEELASRHPAAGHLPATPRLRAAARSLMSEMHAGFGALRAHCPMNLRVSYTDCAPPPEVLADLARIEELWSWAREVTGADRTGEGGAGEGGAGEGGPWLCGPYSAADAFFAPVATRIATYNLPVGPAAQAYVAAHLAHPHLRQWRAMGLAEGADQPFYRRDWRQRPWPGPTPLPARAVEGTAAENAACPYSGRAVTHVLEFEGRRFGFCNAMCRDKTVVDPEAWPAFLALARG
jgi:glutathione S-transferase